MSEPAPGPRADLFDHQLQLGDSCVSPEVVRYGFEQATLAMRQALETVLDETFHLSAADLLFPKRA